MTAKPVQMAESARRRRRVALGVFRSLATIVVLVGLYYLLPLAHLASVPLAAILVVALLILLAVAVWQLHQIGRDGYPVVRAGEALTTTVPLFWLLFASGHLVMAQTARPTSNSLPHPHRLAVQHGTTFSTVGSETSHPPAKSLGPGDRPDHPRPAGPGPGYPGVPQDRAARPAGASRGRRPDCIPGTATE